MVGGGGDEEDKYVEDWLDVGDVRFLSRFAGGLTGMAITCDIRTTNGIGFSWEVGVAMLTFHRELL